MIVGRSFHTATLLGDGLVLVTGGIGDNVLATADLYNPATNAWSSAGAMATARVYQTATLLANGLVLITGGAG